MKQLPPKQKVVFDLRIYGDLKYEEMANVLNRSTGTLKANFHHAVRKVERAVLEEFADA
jgi:RNA polymerase sigma-70 factor (ECF subfamily)